MSGHNRFEDDESHQAPDAPRSSVTRGQSTFPREAGRNRSPLPAGRAKDSPRRPDRAARPEGPPTSAGLLRADRKSTRLNSSHSQISYAVFCLKKKRKKRNALAVLSI